VNVNANANAYAGAFAGAGAYINAQGYDVGAIRGQGGYGGTVVHGSGGVDMGGYGGGYIGQIVVRGPGYGPSRPFGYVAQGFGRRYVTTDRCCGLRPAPCYDNCGGGGGYVPPAPPPLAPYPTPCNCQGGHDHGHGGGYGYEQSYSGGQGGSSYSSYESYSESSSQGGAYGYQQGYAGGYQGGYTGGGQYAEAPRYAPIPYHASPLEPVAYPQGYDQGAYAPPPVQYSQQSYAAPQVQYAQPTYAPVEPQVYQPAPVYIQTPQGYYGDLPPGDTGQGYTYRQEPGERG
jgi:loricrin